MFNGWCNKATCMQCTCTCVSLLAMVTLASYPPNAWYEAIVTYISRVNFVYPLLQVFGLMVTTVSSHPSQVALSCSEEGIRD